MIIGIAGLRTSGKDTVGQYLVNQYNFEQRAFADKLKDGICALFDITREQLEYMKHEYQLPTGGIRAGGFIQVQKGIYKHNPETNRLDTPSHELISNMSIREILQRFGTEVGRDIYGKDFWLDQCLPFDKSRSVEEHHNYVGQNIVVTDMRFENECERVKECGGYTWLIDRPGLVSDGHRSEPEYDDGNYDCVVANHGNLDDLPVAIEQAYNWCLDDKEGVKTDREEWLQSQ